ATADRYGRYSGGSVKVVDRLLTVPVMPSGGLKYSAWVTACGRSLEISNQEYAGSWRKWSRTMSTRPSGIRYGPESDRPSRQSMCSRKASSWVVALKEV